ncbi:MAG: cation-translocating P-type ATPase [Tetragenococcus halophilus]|uniref:Cation-translocating P-type ATPase n=1 Tax=Tetragenococcus halophilus TaxID=51669 RepID=A0A3G5FM43_TETHA|nr:cation-translocating P-type ATPase [Tetragenococcus halophilus]AYW51315.1 cation-translocating P-type ATPase [Tetragenococcus halophilus]MDN6141652.1 cation-translocating P-type ATPase [Tetragenococcus halophilus]MDN6143158.1 cation-translocating P-type ATPase [Tetragenococcus halophilus]MDN6152970.1 cation-translocating P-type ATPase [Tetragenococcus halophilus]MDN6163034.1 cation-translocating P-type ATPase [Tetragenococcus halophilus]
MNYYQQEKKDVLEQLNVDKSGLSQQEVKRRQETEGFNEIEQGKKKSIWALFFDSFKDAMVVILLIAAIVQVLLGDYIETIVIMIVLIMNAIISVVQTKKAESSLDALRQMSAPTATAIRKNEKQTIPARELVPGDIVFLEAGDYIPADGRIIENGSLQVNEGMLTGESEVVDKTEGVIEQEAALGDRTNLVFSSSLVTNGRATFVVTATGAKSEIGKIADMLNTAEQKQTPLQRKLDSFSKKLGIWILLLSIGIFIVQAARIWFGDQPTDLTEELLQALMFAVAIAVAAVPEALQSIVTIVLSVGTNKMARQHAIIRKLPAVETLGSTSIICTDKTGTLTKNKMTVVDYFLPSQKTQNNDNESAEWSFAKERLIDISVLCNDSYVNTEENEIGDPTEIALVNFAQKQGLESKKIRETNQRIDELPFDSDRKLMSTLNDVNDERLMLTKGGPDVMFKRAKYILVDGKEQPLSQYWYDYLINQNESFSSRALRVLAFGYKKMSSSKEKLSFDDESELVLVGLMAMIDPPREVVYGAIKKTKAAGMKTIMITGDHKTTAEAIGKNIGLMEEGDFAVTGQELDEMSDEELNNNLEHISVYARVSPENKIRIVEAWQAKNQISAMTGDGVNDAPALKQADIGIAMGSGTDVSKDASAMILTDDNFVSIVRAVEVGRTVFDNIKKAIAYLFSGNLGAIIAILFAVVLDLPNPFTALQLLFVNLVNDSLPAIALGMENSEPGIMDRKPRSVNEGIFAGETLRSVLTRGSIIGIAVIVSHQIGLQYSNEMGVAMAFTTLILSRTLQTFAARSNQQTILGVGFTTNKYVLAAVAFCLTLYVITILPGLRSIFSIPNEFGMDLWAPAAGLSLAAIFMMEVVKVIYHKFFRK